MSAPHVTASRPLESAQWRQLAWITAGAIAIYAGLRLLPTGTNLSHMDFRVDAKAGQAIEFCDPANPQFIPVVAARSPVVMTLATGGPPAAGREVRATVRLATSSGKAIAPEDLVVTHTRRLHLLIVDPTLGDYQHVHPEPGTQPGEWRFTFTPQRAGTYRVFADFTPAATGRGLYASTDLEIAGGSDTANTPPPRHRGTTEIDGTRFSLAAAQSRVLAGQPIDLRFEMQRTDGGAVRLEPVMGAFAHLVAFDEARSGFAHLHPAETDLLKAPDAHRPVLNFKLTIPKAGNYVVWAQLNLAGRETFVAFELRVD